MATFVKNHRAAFKNDALNTLPISGYSLVFSMFVFDGVKLLKCNLILSIPQAKSTRMVLSPKQKLINSRKTDTNGRLPNYLA